MATQIFAAHILQSNLAGQDNKPVGLAEHIIEDYEPNRYLQASPSISLSNKKNSLINSTASVEPEKFTFEEKLHLANPSKPVSK